MKKSNIEIFWPGTPQISNQIDAADDDDDDDDDDDNGDEDGEEEEVQSVSSDNLEIQRCV